LETVQAPGFGTPDHHGIYRTVEDKWPPLKVEETEVKSVDGHFFYLEGPLSPGQEGSPVLDHNSNVVGMVTSLRNSRGTELVAISTARVRALFPEVFKDE
jgi:S1-C subfamily serine protease